MAILDCTQKNIYHFPSPKKLSYSSATKNPQQKKNVQFFSDSFPLSFPFHSKKKQRSLHRCGARFVCFFLTKALWFQSKDEPLENDLRHLSRRGGTQLITGKHRDGEEWRLQLDTSKRHKNLSKQLEGFGSSNIYVYICMYVRIHIYTTYIS